MTVPDLGLVAVFVKVVELESFTSAANALGLPKSSVSRSVSQLEEALGVRLLQRTSRQLSLTEAGRGFFDRVREPLHGVVDALDTAAESNRSPSGVIRLTAPGDMGGSVLAAPLSEFVRKYPDIKLELTLTSRVVDLIQERFDIAIRATQRLEDSSLVARRIGGPAVGLFASSAYLKRRGKPKTVAELADHDCILFRAHGTRATWRLEGPNGEERVDVTGPINVDDIGFVRRAIEEGVGIGLLPMLFRSEAVRVLPEHRSASAGSLFVVMPSGRHIPARVALLRDFLLDKLKAACNE
jgi:DNA-binding transcriptional LysR family regulator